MPKLLHEAISTWTDTRMLAHAQLTEETKTKINLGDSYIVMSSITSEESWDARLNYMFNTHCDFKHAWQGKISMCKAKAIQDQMHLNMELPNHNKSS